MYFSIHLCYHLQELSDQNKSSDACSLHVLNPKTSKVVQLEQFCFSERSVLKCVNFESLCKSSPKFYLRRGLLMSTLSLSVFYCSYLLWIFFFDFASAPFGKMWLPRFEVIVCFKGHETLGPITTKTQNQMNQSSRKIITKTPFAWIRCLCFKWENVCKLVTYCFLCASYWLKTVPITIKFYWEPF